MARRRKNQKEEAFRAAFGLVGAVILLCMILPPFRQGVEAIGVLVLFVAVITLLGFIGFRMVRKLVNKPSSDPWDLGSRRQLREQRPLQSYNLNTLEAVPNRPAKAPPKDDSRYMPPVAVSPSPIITPAVIPPPVCPPVPPRPRPETMDPGPESLIERLRAIDWYQFEKIVALLYELQGYVVERRGGANPDGGIDMVIFRNGARRAVQCKQWKSWKLPEKTVREFVGAMHIAEITQGVIVILGDCTEPARRLARERGIEIVDEDVLARMLVATGAPYDREVRALLDDERKFCPKCESEMVLRTAKENRDHQFWGCSTYPRCKGQIPCSAENGFAYPNLNHRSD